MEKIGAKEDLTSERQRLSIERWIFENAPIIALDKFAVSHECGPMKRKSKEVTQNKLIENKNCIIISSQD